MKVTLLEAPQYPVELLWSLWQASRTDDPLLVPQKLSGKLGSDEREELFVKLLAMDIPVMENLFFVFMLEDVPVSFREQLVRHRTATYWSQTSRVRDMGEFHEKGRYFTPETVKQNPTLLKAYGDTLEYIQDCYNQLLKDGIPREDARQLLPMASTHRISWGVNLRALKHTLANRTCWIAQAGLWHPVVKGVVSELVAKVHPALGMLAKPPCWDLQTGCAEGAACPFVEENVRRLAGTDPFPPCPIWLRSCSPSQVVIGGGATWTRNPTTDRWSTGNPTQDDMMGSMHAQFEKLWSLQ
jgi:thymidylate synthase (FAD)